MLKFNDIKKLLKDTKLSGLSEQQIQEALIGSYPLSHGSEEIKRLWEKTIESYGDAYLLELVQVDCLLDGMITKIYQSKADPKVKEEQAEKVLRIKEYLNTCKSRMIESEGLKQIIKDCQVLIADYETKIRKQQIEIESLKENIK
jgi:hypothetical protein